MHRQLGTRVLATGLSLVMAAGLTLPAGVASAAGEKWGFVDLHDQIVVPFQYDQATAFHSGFATVKQDGKWGVINTAGELVIPCQYSELEQETDTDQAFFSVLNGDGTRRMLDSQGRTIGPASYDSCSAQGSTLVFHCGDQWLPYRDDGTPLDVPAGYTAGYEDGGVLIAYRGDYMGVLSLDGQIVVPADYDSVMVYPNTKLIQVEKGGLYGLYRMDGTELLPCTYDSINGDYVDAGETWYGTAGIVSFETQGKGGAFSLDGELLLECPYSVHTAGLEEGPFLATSDGMYGLLGSQGQLLTSLKYDYIGNFSDGLAMAESGGKYGYLDTAGTEVIPLQFDSAGDFSQGLAPVEKDGRWYYIDETGQEAMTPDRNYDQLHSFTVSGVAQADVGGRKALIDRQGREVVAPTDETGVFTSYFDAPGSIVCLSGIGTSNGLYKADGTPLVPAGNLTLCTYPEDGLVVVMKDSAGKTACYDQMGNAILPYGKYDQIGIASDWEGGYGDGLFLVATDDPDLLNQNGELHADAWALESVKKAQAAGLIPDALQGADLTRTITRAEFAAVSVKLYEAMSGQAAPAATENPFTDTNDPAVLQAYALGLTTGTSATTFSPAASLTREQAATMLARVYTRLGGTLEGGTLNFSDAGSISGWAVASVSFMTGQGILNGVGGNRFAPAQANQRQEALTIAVRMLETLG